MLIDIFYPNEGYATQAVLPQFGAAMIAGFTASACSIPFDMIKTKLQNTNEFKGITDAALHILRKEGVLAFWTGFPAYYMRCVRNRPLITAVQPTVVVCVSLLHASNCSIRT
jgi:solute carrier family 25 (mitochondrial oxoglutarate transporter), member 11